MSSVPPAAAPPARGPFALCRLTQRADFLRAAKGRVVHTRGFVLQIQPNDSGDIRVGVTCSKKVGNAVQRNRAKRRLREIARLILPSNAQPGHDYVLIGRRAKTAMHPFHHLQADLVTALRGTAT